mgnify:CR=1 FL=1
MKPGRYIWLDPESGLEAVLHIDSLVLGPAVGGVRTKSYRTLNDAIADAELLARAMTIKNALAGLDAGGCKLVVRTGARLDRPKAFARLGRLLAELGDHVHTGADLGTTQEDLEHLKSTFPNVHMADDALVDAAGLAVVRCIEACARVQGRSPEGLRIAVQGAGIMGEAVARALVERGASLVIGDTEPERAQALAEALGGEVVEPEGMFELDVDVVAPCAIGGVIDEDVARRVKAWAVCGAANNVITSRSAERELVERDVLWVPDVISSAGAVTHGIASSLMGIADTRPMIERLGTLAEEVLREAQLSARTPEQVAMDRAEARILAASES